MLTDATTQQCTLASLPVELLLHIGVFLPPKARYNFACSSQNLWALNRTCLHKHRALLAQYKTLQASDPKLWDKMYNIFKDFSEDEDLTIVESVRNLDLQDCSMFFDPTIEDMEDMQLVYSGPADELQKSALALLNRSNQIGLHSFGNSHRYGDGWSFSNAIEMGLTDAYIALLLLTCPFIENISITIGDTYGLIFEFILDMSITTVAKCLELADQSNPKPFPSYLPLRYLTRVRVRGAAELSLSHLCKPFLLLPSVRSLELEDILEELQHRDNWDFNDPLPSLSNIEELKFGGCAISNLSLTTVLKQIRALKSFSFSDRDDRFFEAIEFNRGCIRALHEYTAHSLEYLLIPDPPASPGEVTESGEPIWCGDGIDSILYMQGFEVLSTLCISIKNFIKFDPTTHAVPCSAGTNRESHDSGETAVEGIRNSTGQDHVAQQANEKDSRDNEQVTAYEDVINRHAGIRIDLAISFPDSLRVLWIKDVKSYHTAHLIKMVRDRKELPLLRTLWTDLEGSGREILTKECEQYGIEHCQISDTRKPLCWRLPE